MHLFETGVKPVHVDKVLVYFGDRIGVSPSETVQPGEEEALQPSVWVDPKWWKDDEMVSYGAWSPERSATIRFVFFENVETESIIKLRFQIVKREKDMKRNTRK